MSTFDSSKSQFNQYHFSVVEIDLPIVEGVVDVSTSIKDAAPQWYWKLDEIAGDVAVDEMNNGNLEYESIANTDGYSIAPSNVDGVGSAKAILGDSTLQIYDPVILVAPPTDYVAYWTMDDADISGTTLLDSTANSHDATMVNTPTTGQIGQVNEGIDFSNLSTEYATVVDHVDFQTSNFSATCWVNLTADTGQNQTILQSYDFGSSVHAGWKFHIYTDGTLKVGMFVADNTGQVAGVDYIDAFGTTVITTGTLHHVAATYDGANVKLYLNGVLDATVAWAGGVGYKGTNKVTIAAENTTQFGISWLPRGILDELKYFDRALTSSEIQSIYAADGGL